MYRHLDTAQNRVTPWTVQYRLRLRLTVDELVAVALNGQPNSDSLKVVFLLHHGVPQVGVIHDKANGRREVPPKSSVAPSFPTA